MEEISSTVEAADTSAAESRAETWGEGLDEIISELDAAGEEQEAEAEADPPLPEDDSSPGQEDAGSFTLRHLDETRTVDRGEVIALAQKGMDYDRVRRKLEEARSRLEGLEGFLNRAAEGGDVGEFMDRLDAARLSRSGGLSPEEAMKIAREERQSREKTSRAELERRLKIASDTREFAEKFPEAALRYGSGKEPLPPDIWEAVRGGMRLCDAYALYEARQAAAKSGMELSRLRSELDSRRLAEKNAARSAGSRRTAGGDRGIDPIIEGWNSV